MGIEGSYKILVIGGSGFIGGAIVKHAISIGWEVDSMGLAVPSKEKQISGANYIRADITNPDTLKILSSKKYHYVVNAGGYINHSIFSDGGSEVLGAHFGGVVNLVQNINKAKLIRFVNIGSSDEYGDAAAPQLENTRERPISPYSAGKVAATHLLQMLHKTEGFPAVALRLFLCYGPGQDHMRFLPYLISRCLADEEIKVSPGEQLRDYCFIDDIVEAVFMVLSNDAADGKVFNIASGKPVSIRTIVEKMVDIIGSGKPNFGAVPYREGESMELYADINYADEVLSWTPKTQLSEGLEKTIRFYRSQLA